MTQSLWTSTLATLVLLGFGCVAPSKLPVGNPYPGYCPVMGEAVNAEKAANNPKLYVDYNGQRYLMCCNKCKPMFEKDPEKWIKDPMVPEE